MLMYAQSYKKRKTPAIVLVSYFLITLIWGVYRLWLEKPLLSGFTPLAGALLEGGIKCLLMVLPPLLLMRVIGDDMHIPADRFMKPNLRTLWMGLALSAVFFIIHLLRYTASGVQVWLTLNIPVKEIVGAVIFAALTEEILFRGFMLNSLVKLLGRVQANILIAVLFALMHIPIWIAGGTVGLLPLPTGPVPSPSPRRWTPAP